jgi:hypothetical protein
VCDSRWVQCGEHDSISRINNNNMVILCYHSILKVTIYWLKGVGIPNGWLCPLCVTSCTFQVTETLLPEKVLSVVRRYAEHEGSRQSMSMF